MFFLYAGKKDFTYENHLLKVTEKPVVFLSGLNGPNVNVGCIIVFLFQQWEYYTGMVYDRFEDLVDDADGFQRFMYAIDIFVDEGLDSVYEKFRGNTQLLVLTHQYHGDFLTEKEICAEINNDLFSELICGQVEIAAVKNLKLQNYTTWKTLITSSTDGSDEEKGEFFFI